MKASILVAPGKLEIRDVPDPKPSEGQVLLKVNCVGICGTDVAVYRGDHQAKKDVILGHEYCGEVAEAGKGVSKFKPGDYVASEASWGCGLCEWCVQGQGSFCEKLNSLARTVDGALAEYILVPVRMLHPLDRGVTPVEGQGVVGIATGLRAVHRAGVNMAQRVLIIGPGYGGLILLQLCKLAGARVGIVGTRAQRLAIAEEVGADFTENVKTNPEWEKTVIEKYAPMGFDVVIEAAGTLSALLAAARTVRKGGIVLQFGTSYECVNGLPQKDFYYREISIIGTKGGYGCYPAAVDLLNRHALKIAPLITHEYPLAKVAEAFEVMDKRLHNVMRAAVVC
ncbi:MAG: alcohol dehydrogenase catalytic domain-containing protein [Candidatus Korobacteraceae bacterium]